MRHDEAWKRLPDLLDDRDDPGLLAHLQACADCQRQLFLLGRVDRLLRDRQPTAATAGRPVSRVRSRAALGSAMAVAGALAIALALFVLQAARTQTLTLRTASGKAVGQAVMGHSDARNVSVALSAQHLPVRHGGQVFVLWAGGNGRAAMQVGRFMVDQSGGCSVRFNLPADHAWGRFWITRPQTPDAIVARP